MVSRPPPAAPMVREDCGPSMSTPLQGQGACPTPSQLLPVTPLGKLGMAAGCGNIIKPHFNFFFPLDSQPEVTPSRTAPALPCPPLTLPQAWEVPRGHQPPWEEPGRGSEASPTPPARGDAISHPPRPHGGRRIRPYPSGNMGLVQIWGYPGGGGLQGHQFLELPVTHRSRPGATGAAVPESSGGSSCWVPASGTNHRPAGIHPHVTGADRGVPGPAT